MRKFGLEKFSFGAWDSPYLNKVICLPGKAESMGKMMRANTIKESNRRDENFFVAIILALVNDRRKYSLQNSLVQYKC